MALHLLNRSVTTHYCSAGRQRGKDGRGFVHGGNRGQSLFRNIIQETVKIGAKMSGHELALLNSRLGIRCPGDAEYVAPHIPVRRS